MNKKKQDKLEDMLNYAINIDDMNVSDIIEALVNAGAKVDYENIINMMSADYFNVYMLLTKEDFNEHIKIVMSLLKGYKKQGGDIDAEKDEFLELATFFGLSEVVYYIVDELGATVKGTKVLSDLSYLSFYTYTDIEDACKYIKFLIDKGADVDSYKDDDSSIANCSTGSLVVFNQSSKLREERANKILQLLVDNGANVNLLIEHPDMHYTLSLISASVYANNFKSAHILLDNGADVNLVGGKLKRNALMSFADSDTYACYINKKERDYVLKEIVRKTKDLDAKDTKGETALQIAMKNGREDVVSEIEKEKERRNKFADRG